MSTSVILLLEDDSARVGRFRTAISLLQPACAVRIWSNAFKMIDEIPELLGTACLIALDHDLESLTGGSDPGDGLLVARFLVSQPAVRPVIVHSSNAERAQMMMGEFELAGWPHLRVLPFGEEWIERDWRRAAERLIARDTP